MIVLMALLKHNIPITEILGWLAGLMTRADYRHAGRRLLERK